MGIKCITCVDCAELGDGVSICLLKSNKDKLEIIEDVNKTIECPDFEEIPEDFFDEEEDFLDEEEDYTDEELKELESIDNVEDLLDEKSDSD